MRKILFKFFFASSIILIAVAIFIYGREYYLLPDKERFFSKLHPLLKPGGLIGHGLGILGSLMIVVGVFSYMAKKRIKRFAYKGSLKPWLTFHIYMCVLGPVLILFHTSFKFGGIVSVSFWSMVAVVISGFVGRFIYLHLPRNVEGKELSKAEAEKLYSDLVNKLKTDSNVNASFYELLNPEAVFISNDEDKVEMGVLIKNRIARRKTLKEIKAKIASYDIPEKEKKKILNLAKSILDTAFKISLLKMMHKLFEYWHIAHLPFALLMLIIVVVHVIIAVTLGYTWVNLL